MESKSYQPLDRYVELGDGMVARIKYKRKVNMSAKGRGDIILITRDRHGNYLDPENRVKDRADELFNMFYEKEGFRQILYKYELEVKNITILQPEYKDQAIILGAFYVKILASVLAEEVYSEDCYLFELYS